jgi:hypothetical protein
MIDVFKIGSSRTAIIRLRSEIVSGKKTVREKYRCYYDSCRMLAGSAGEWKEGSVEEEPDRRSQVPIRGNGRRIMLLFTNVLGKKDPVKR